MPRIIEIKAHCPHAEQIRQTLMEHNAWLKGEDHQVDTYFVVANGRLKLRQGRVESALIHYQRPNQTGPKLSDVSLYRSADYPALKSTLEKALGIWVEVDKRRAIYFIDNVKFHIDQVKGLGSFVEIEAIDEDGSISIEQLQQQCDRYLQLLNIPQEALIDRSYSDLLYEQGQQSQLSPEE
ncbi:MAG: class IV adenylate cyclase [Bacteroidota bacterium]